MAGTGTADPDAVAVVELVGLEEDGAEVLALPQAAATTPTKTAAIMAAHARHRRGLGKMVMLPVRFAHESAPWAGSTWVPATSIYPMRPAGNRPTPCDRSKQPLPIRGWADR